MSKYIYNDEGHCTNGDGMYYKANGVTASYHVAQNKHGYARTYEIEGNSMSVIRPLSWDEEDVSATKEQAISIVKSELKRMLVTTNYNNQFDGLLMAMGEIPIQEKETVSKPQLSLF